MSIILLSRGQLKGYLCYANLLLTLCLCGLLLFTPLSDRVPAQESLHLEENLVGLTWTNKATRDLNLSFYNSYPKWKLAE